MLERADYDAVEAAEAQLDEFIRKRSREKSDEQKVAELWAESDRKHREKRRRENRAAWYSYHCDLQAVHQGLADRHRERAESFLEEAV